MISHLAFIYHYTREYILSLTFAEALQLYTDSFSMPYNCFDDSSHSDKLKVPNDNGAVSSGWSEV